jgi:hypothetical protein
MKKILVALAIAAFASTSYAVVENSAHDFNASATYGVAKASRCVYCHVPHAAQTWANTALWATGQATGTFDYYSAEGLVVTGISVKESQTCLACHADGTTATTGLAAAITGAKNVEYNLKNDHPIGTEVVMTPGSGGMKNPLVIGRHTIVGGETVECATCHSVHGLSGYTIEGRKLLYGPGNSGLASGWPSTTDFCNVCHTR